jgi:hypothetical protein
MTPQEVLEELKNLNISDTDGKIIVDPGIDPLTTSTEQAKTLIEEQINTLTKKGVSPSNIGIIGLDSAFGDMNKAFEEITNALGAGFGGPFESSMDLDSYLIDLDDIIENKIAGSLSAGAELPENIQLDQGLISKFARTISGVADIFGEAVLNFPDHMLCEERPIDGKTPLHGRICDHPFVPNSLHPPIFRGNICAGIVRLLRPVPGRIRSGRHGCQARGASAERTRSRVDDRRIGAASGIEPQSRETGAYPASEGRESDGRQFRVSQVAVIGRSPSQERPSNGALVLPSPPDTCCGF